MKLKKFIRSKDAITKTTAIAIIVIMIIAIVAASAYYYYAVPSPPTPPPTPTHVTVYFYCDFETYPFTPPWDSVDTYGGGRVTQEPFGHTGRYSAKLLFAHPGKGDQACKFFQYDQLDYCKPYISTKEAYYSVWYWFPKDFRVVDWRMILQWGQMGGPMPIVSLKFVEGKLYVENRNSARPEWARTEGKYKRWDTGYTPNNIPKGRWLRFVVYMKNSSEWRQRDGRLKLWINGELKVDITGDICTNPRDVETWMWGPLHYGGKNEPKGQRIFIDDVKVTSYFPV